MDELVSDVIEDAAEDGAGLLLGILIGFIAGLIVGVLAQTDAGARVRGKTRERFGDVDLRGVQERMPLVNRSR